MKPHRHLTKSEELSAGAKAQEFFRLEDVKKSGGSLTPEQERAWADGKVATELLVRSNLGLVYQAANVHQRKYPTGMDFDDVYADGLVGLWTAVRKYDPARGNKFSTMAVSWIRQAISRGSNKTSRLVRLPENRILELSKILRIRQESIDAGLSDEETTKLICEKVSVTEAQLRDILSANNTHVSLNRPVSSGEESVVELLELSKVISPAVSAEEDTLRGNVSSVVYSVLRELPQSDVDIFSTANKLGLSSMVTQKECCEAYGLSSAMYHRRAEEVREILKSRLQDDKIGFLD